LLELIPVVVSYCLVIACESGAGVLARCLDVMGRDRHCVMFAGWVEYADNEQNANPNLINSNLKRFIALFYC